MVVAREGDAIHKVQLAPRIQEAIDEAAMRLGDVGSDDYLAGWTRSDWETQEGEPAEVAERVSHALESEWSEGRIAAFLDTLGG